MAFLSLVNSNAIGASLVYKEFGIGPLNSTVSYQTYNIVYFNKKDTNRSFVRVSIETYLQSDHEPPKGQQRLVAMDWDPFLWSHEKDKIIGKNFRMKLICECCLTILFHSITHDIAALYTLWN